MPIAPFRISVWRRYLEQAAQTIISYGNTSLSCCFGNFHRAFGDYTAIDCGAQTLATVGADPPAHPYGSQQWAIAIEAIVAKFRPKLANNAGNQRAAFLK